MIALVRSWLIGVTGVAILVALADALTPEGAIKRVGRLTGGLVLMVAMLTPILRLDITELLDPNQWMGELAMAEERLTLERDDALRESVCAQYASYIVEKARASDVALTATVTCRQEGELFLPSQVTIVGRLTDEEKMSISAWISDDFALTDGAVSFEEDGQ